MLNALTVDVEDWYQTNGLDIPINDWNHYEDRVVGSTAKILDMLDEYKVKGTFFVLGCVAERHPTLVLDISNRGHEIASHGGWHRLVTSLSAKEFRQDVQYSKDVLESITGQPVTMYRAPSWSIGPGRYEYLRILEELGFFCDSSLQPFHTPLSGVKGAPSQPFHPVLDGIPQHILEFPSTVWKLASKTIPFSGGFYLRVMPYRIIKRAMNCVNRMQPGMIYLHPWEFDPSQPRVWKGPLRHLAQYYRLASMELKVRRLLTDFSFCPLTDAVKGQAYAQVELD